MMAWRRGRRGCQRARQRALEQKIHPSSRDLLHPLAHRLTYNLPAKHGFNLTLSRYRSARTSRRVCQSCLLSFSQLPLRLSIDFLLRKACVVLLPAKPALHQRFRFQTYKHTKLILLSLFSDQLMYFYKCIPLHLYYK